MKTLECDRSVEVGKTKPRSSTRQDDGGHVDDSDLGDVNDMKIIEMSKVAHEDN
jgi:hypothetical protein